MGHARLLALAVLLSCSSDQSILGRRGDVGVPNPKELAPTDQLDRLVQVKPTEVDILWVIDNSCSMSCVVGCHGTVASVVADNFPAFMQHFLGSGIDYHIGVVTTDMADPHHQGQLQPARGVRFVDPSTPEPVRTFYDMAVQGTRGSDFEKGLQANYVALEFLGDTDNADFFRPTAELHTIVLADEDDQSNEDVITLDEFIAWYDNVRPGVERSYNGIVCVRTSVPCSYGPSQTYLDAIDAIGGLTVDIQEDDWTAALSELGAAMSGARAEYFLSRLPVVDTLEVRVVLEDGTEVAFTEEEWVYSPVRNSITFVDYLPPAKAEVRVSYTVDGTA